MCRMCYKQKFTFTENLKQLIHKLVRLNSTEKNTPNHLALGTF